MTTTEQRKLRKAFTARVEAVWADFYRINKVKGARSTIKNNGMICDIVAAFDELVFVDKPRKVVERSYHFAFLTGPLVPRGKTLSII